MKTIDFKSRFGSEDSGNSQISAARKIEAGSREKASNRQRDYDSMVEGI